MKKVIKIRAEWNEIENKKIMQEINTKRPGSLKRLIKLMNTWLDSLRKKREKTHIHKIRNEIEVTKDITDI